MKPDAQLAALLADRPQLVNRARRLLGQHAEAEDVVQDACLRALQAPARQIETPRAWMHTVVRHLSIDRLRRRQHELPAADGTAPEATAPSAEDAAGAIAEGRAAVRLLADTLSPVEAAAVLLHEVFGESHADIAVRCARSEAACRQLLRRALRRLRKAAARGVARPEDRATADAVFVLCLRALDGRQPAPLHALLREAALSLRAPVDARADAPATLRTQAAVVQWGGCYALSLVLDGGVVYRLPLGPVLEVV